MGASLQGRAVYHPSCSLARKLGVKDETTYAAEKMWDWSCLPLLNRIPAADLAARSRSKWPRYPARW